MFIYALIGKSFFYGDLLDTSGNLSRYTFNGMFNSMLTMFVLLSGENWNDINNTLYNAHGIPALLFCISAVVIGNLVLLNMFLAILLKYIEDGI